MGLKQTAKNVIGIFKKKTPDEPSGKNGGRRLLDAPPDECPMAWSNPPIYHKNSPAQKVTDKARGVKD